MDKEHDFSLNSTLLDRAEVDSTESMLKNLFLDIQSQILTRNISEESRPKNLVPIVQ